MPCQNMQYWTFTGLVGAFLDLGIAYCVLCASSLAFFVSEFLGLFGLRLPCPCDGMFTRPRNHYCLQRLLFDYPHEKVGYVLCSVRNKFPFHSELTNDENLGVKLVEERSNLGNGYYVDFEAEASCSSVSDAKVSRNTGEKEMVPRKGIGFEFNVGRWPDKKIDMKGKGISIHRPRANMRRRRKGGYDHKRSSSVSSHDQVPVPRYSSSIKKEKNEDLGGMSASDEADTNYLSGGSGSRDVDLNSSLPGMNLKEKYESSNEDFMSDARGALSLGDEINTIGVLEQALKEEHAARVALYIELDKERHAAASAADEAMAMILRLQEEKASVEMQARQYQREIEEKSAYDTEEMNILKEIVLRREREKHFLEKEVEAYRQLLYSGKEQSELDIQSIVDKQRRESSSGYLSDDTDLMLRELNESLGKNTAAKGRISNAELTCKDTQQRPFVQLGSSEWNEDDVVPTQQGKDKYSSLNSSDDVNQELQEKEMVSVGNSQLAQPIEGQGSNNSEEPQFPKSTIPCSSDEQKKNGSEDIYGGITKNVNTNMSSVPIQIDDDDIKKHEKDTMENIVQSNEANKKEPVYDVHVINNNSKIFNEASGKKTEILPKTDTSKVTPDVSQEVSDIHKRESPSTSKIGIATDSNRSTLDMAMRLPPPGPREKSVPVSHRSSISVSDTERLKIDMEVEWLREKLRAVQERRTKLNVSVDHDKEKLQLQLLEDIASQLREIRVMTHPEKAMRQASLPLPSSEVSTYRL
ncbi:hypothetical protein DCAR_0833035 [Daucus carota subsp. sativus]|uniref:GTD-binding domain-containing protein n=1 Tax=Daucus carota subsp. sativus TaxID=79200 RepID=A0AAF0XT49_DAUCS|nr:hypothetical protein DCAR_0833035 [Daucus carota subsp. sativus]